MNYAEIKTYDVANGPGVRLSLFVSGCTHRCKGCFNAATWDFGYGSPYTREVEDRILTEVGQPWYAGLTLLGGEPMEPVNQRGLISLIRRFREKFPQKDIWCFSGYLLEDMLPGGRVHTEVTDELLRALHVLVDGEFKESLKDITLLYKGSSNQRTIDMPKSLERGEVVLWEPEGVSISGKVRI